MTSPCTPSHETSLTPRGNASAPRYRIPSWAKLTFRSPSRPSLCSPMTPNARPGPLRVMRDRPLTHWHPFFDSGSPRRSACHWLTFPPPPSLLCPSLRTSPTRYRSSRRPSPATALRWLASGSSIAGPKEPYWLNRKPTSFWAYSPPSATPSRCGTHRGGVTPHPGNRSLGSGRPQRFDRASCFQNCFQVDRDEP